MAEETETDREVVERGALSAGAAAVATATAPAMPLPFCYSMVGFCCVVVIFFCWHCSVVFLGGDGGCFSLSFGLVRDVQFDPRGIILKDNVWIFLRFLRKI